MAPDHYAQCPVRNSTNWPANGPVFCLCYLIAKVEAEVRERIAQEIEAQADDWSDWDAIVKTEGDMLALRDLVKDAIHDAAAIARGGESDALADEYDRAQNGWGNFLEVDR